MQLPHIVQEIACSSESSDGGMSQYEVCMLTRRVNYYYNHVKAMGFWKLHNEVYGDSVPPTFWDW